MNIPTLRPPHIVPMMGSVAGIGLTTTQRIEPGETIGVSHVMHSAFADGVVRTFVGALVNHSDTPNAYYFVHHTQEGVYFTIVADEAIPPGREIFVKYGTFSEPPEVTK